MTSYAWANASLFKADANEVAEKISELIDKNGGHCTKDDILAEAQKAASPLNVLFEWNDRKAANIQRRTQATRLMGNLRRARNGKPSHTRAYVYVQLDDERGRKGYVTIDTAVRSQSFRHQLLKQAWRELASWRQRYAGYKELSEVIGLIHDEAERHTEAKEA